MGLNPPQPSSLAGHPASRALGSGGKEALPPQLATKSISLTPDSIRLLYLGWQVGGSNVLPPLDCVVLGAPPVPPHHVEWVLAAAAGAGGLAPEFPFLPVPSKNRDDKDSAARFVRQCVCVGGTPVQTQAPYSWARGTQPPASPTHAPAAHSLPLLGQLLLRIQFLREHCENTLIGL